MRHEVARAAKQAVGSRDKEQAKGGNAFDRLLADEAAGNTTLPPRKRRDRDERGLFFQRNRLLDDLGFDSFTAYLKSPIFQSLRRKVLSRDNWTCAACKRRGTHIVATVYTASNLAGRSTEHLHVLCKTCRRFVEYNGSRKLRLHEQIERIQLLLDGNYGLPHKRPARRRPAGKTPQTR